MIKSDSLQWGTKAHFTHRFQKQDKKVNHFSNSR